MADRASWGLAFGAGCLVTVLLHALLDGGGSGDAAGAPVRADEAGLVEELRALRQSLDGLDARVAEAAAPTTARPLAGSGAPRSRSADLEPVLDELARAVGRLSEQLDGASGEGVTAAGIRRARDTHRAIDWQQLMPLAEAMTRDPDGAKQVVRFLTPAELLERYGRPTQVWASNGGTSVTWHYGRIERVGDEEHRVAEVNFRIQDGYVIDAYGEHAATEALLEAQGD